MSKIAIDKITNIVTGYIYSIFLIYAFVINLFMNGYFLKW